MALTFSAASTSARVNHGSDTSLDNQSVVTLLCWCYFTAFSGQICSKLGSGHMVFQVYGTGRINLEYERNSDTNNIKVRPQDNFVATNAWQFVGGTFDAAGADADQKLFQGTLSALAVEAGSYSTQQVGSGSHATDAADDLIIGNTKNLGAGNVLNGDIAWLGYWNRQLSLGEIQAQQFNPYPTSGCILFSHYGLHDITGSQPDWSGTGNDGTVTSATAVAHVPLRVIKGITSPLRVPPLTLNSYLPLAMGIPT